MNVLTSKLSVGGSTNASHEYGGDLKRRSRTVSGTTTNYNWDAGFTMINEEDSGGNLTMTYIGKLADVSGDDPSAGTWRYYGGPSGRLCVATQRDGPVRPSSPLGLPSLGQYEYTPYGEIYAESGASIPWKYTGHMWDDTADLYYAPYRYYNPTLARWTTRDPLGMAPGQNGYAYVAGSPVLLVDPLGLWPDWMPEWAGKALDIGGHIIGHSGHSGHFPFIWGLPGHVLDGRLTPVPRALIMRPLFRLLYTACGSLFL